MFDSLWLLFAIFVGPIQYVQAVTNRCPDPLSVIQAPRLAQSNAMRDYGRWKYGFRITYTCAPGHKFPDGRTKKYTKCVIINGKLDWSIKTFPNCYDYCQGSRCLHGRCQFNKFLGKYKCNCLDHYGGRFCNQEKCDLPTTTEIPNGSHNGSMSYSYSLHGLKEGAQVHYRCNTGYVMIGDSMITCMKSGIFHPPSPQCVKKNSYLYKCQRQYDKPTMKETALYKHAMLTAPHYWRGSTIGFSCRKPTQVLVDYKDRPFHGSTRCQRNLQWTRQWPLCKVRTCQRPILDRGTFTWINDLDGFFVDSVTLVTYKCYSPYYLYGNRHAKCLNGKWTSVPKCYNFEAFKNQCMLDGKVLDFQGYNKSEPVCAKPSYLTDDEAAKKQLKTITVVTSTAAVLFGILLIIVAGVAFQRRRLLYRIRRLQEAQTVERDQRDMDHDVYMQFVLPSYDEAQKSKPTSLPPTFDEATRAAEEEEEQQQGATAVIAPSYSVAEDPAPPPYDLTREQQGQEGSDTSHILPTIGSTSSSDESDHFDLGVYLDDAMLL